MKIQLGDEVQDTVTGFKGIAVARTSWITGCNRITIQPKADSKNKIDESQTFDEPLVEVIKAKKMPKEKKKTGGWKPNVAVKPTIKF